MNDLGYEVYSMKPSDLIGDVGEVLTANTLRQLGLTVLRNLYLPYKDHTVEIDMVAICPRCVFVIENKNYKGRIRGSLDADYCTVHYGKVIQRLYNPLKQNMLHISVLRGILENDICLKNVVIFNDYVQGIDICSDNVFTLSEFVSRYQEHNNSGSISISAVSDKLRRYSDMSDEARLLHVSNLYKR